MSDFVSPAAGPVALPAKVASPSVLAPGVPSLAAFLDLMIGKIIPPIAKAAPGKGERQANADGGKILPDGDKKHVDPALAWLFGPIPVPAPQPMPVALPQTAADLAKAVGLALPTPLPGRDGPGEAPTAVPSVATEALASPPTPNPSLAARGKSDPVPTPIAPQMVAPQQFMPEGIPLATTPTAATAALPALFALAMTPDREAHDSDSPTPAVTASQPNAMTTIAPAGDTQRQSLDLGARDWPQKMIDHIETLRDNANANDTSIRLKPEALGRVDVSLKAHNDGAVSVRFTAEQPATRTLLIDAAPQLAAAAEARGIRLSGTSVDLSGQGDQRPRAQADQPQNITNRLAAPRGDDSEAVDDGRIA